MFYIAISANFLAEPPHTPDWRAQNFACAPNAVNRGLKTTPAHTTTVLQGTYVQCEPVAKVVSSTEGAHTTANKATIVAAQAEWERLFAASGGEKNRRGPSV